MKPLLTLSVVIFALLVVPPLLFLAVLGFNPGGGHPSPIIIPYLWVLLGFRFAGPVAAVLALASASMAFSRGASFRFRYGALVLGILLCLGSVTAWIHQFK